VPPPDQKVQLARLGLIGRSIEGVLRGGTIVGVAYCGVLAIRDLSGKQTVAHLTGSFVAQIGTDIAEGNFWWAPWLLCLGTGVWAWGERQLRHRAIRLNTERINLLERQIDPKKGTSGLTPSGQTPQDFQ
jgi:hypothetical protein